MLAGSLAHPGRDGVVTAAGGEGLGLGFQLGWCLQFLAVKFCCYEYLWHRSVLAGG